MLPISDLNSRVTTNGQMELKNKNVSSSLLLALEGRCSRLLTLPDLMSLLQHLQSSHVEHKMHEYAMVSNRFRSHGQQKALCRETSEDGETTRIMCGTIPNEATSDYAVSLNTF